MCQRLPAIQPLSEVIGAGLSFRQSRQEFFVAVHHVPRLLHSQQIVALDIKLLLAVCRSHRSCATQ